MSELGKNTKRFLTVLYTCLETAQKKHLIRFCEDKKGSRGTGVVFPVPSNNKDGYLVAIAHEVGVDFDECNIRMPYEKYTSPEELGAFFGTLVVTERVFEPPECPCCAEKSTNRGGNASTSE